MIIVLIGYMATGKSTLGRILSAKLNYHFLDLDDYIESKENKNISEIFESKGEIHFRKLESFYLNELLEDNDNVVLALGGGTPCYSNNMETLLDSKKTIAIYLKSSINTIVERLLKEKSKRPLVAHINTEHKIAEFVGKHLFERSIYYNKAKHLIVIDGKTKNEIIEEIIFDLF